MTVGTLAPNERDLYKIVNIVRQLAEGRNNLVSGYIETLLDDADAAAARATLGISLGPFTPALAFGGASTGVTYALRSGSYLKIGPRVLVSGIVILSNKGSSTGTATIRSLPFTAQDYGALAVEVNGTTSPGPPHGNVTAGAAWINLDYFAAGNVLARLLAAGPDGVRDGKLAVEYATRACELSELSRTTRGGSLNLTRSVTGVHPQFSCIRLRPLIPYGSL